MPLRQTLRTIFPLLCGAPASISCAVRTTNAVAPGIVATSLHTDNSKEYLESRSPMATVSTVENIASAVVYLTEARPITGEVLHVDGGAHVGKW